jgi:hypothetical protein
MMRRALVFGWVICLLGATSCVSWSDPWERGRALELAQKSYTDAIRWGDIDGAARFVEPELRAGFLAYAEAFETIRITDYEIGEIDLDTENFESAVVDVTYRGYVMPQYVEHRVRDRQIWVRDPDAGNDWHIRPEIASLLDGLGARVSR